MIDNIQSILWIISGALITIITIQIIIIIYPKQVITYLQNRFQEKKQQ